MKFGLPLDEIKHYTPRQAFAVLLIKDDIDQKERAVDLSFAALAAQGRGKDIDKTVKALRGED